MRFIFYFFLAWLLFLTYYSLEVKKTLSKEVEAMIVITEVLGRHQSIIDNLIKVGIKDRGIRL